MFTYVYKAIPLLECDAYGAEELLKKNLSSAFEVPRDAHIRCFLCPLAWDPMGLHRMSCVGSSLN